jgi:hypothetical protein
MMRNAVELYALEPTAPPCPAWCPERHEAVKLRNRLDSAVVDHVLPVGELSVPDHFHAVPDGALVTISAAVVATDYFSLRGHHRYAPMIRVEIDNSSFDVLKLNGPHARDFGRLLDRAAEALDLSLRCAEQIRTDGRTGVENPRPPM